MAEKFNLIYTQSKKCFERSSGAFSDGILVLAVNNDWHNRITFHKYAMDFGLAEPFIILDFKKDKIYIKEGSFGCFFTYCKELNIKPFIQNTLKGKIKCEI